jgi:putative transposase
VIRAYLFALDPTDGQVEQFRSHCGAQRFAFNWGLAHIKANLGQREAERSYGITDDDLTPPVAWSAYSLRRDWNAAKDDVAPWWAENSKEAYSSGLANLSVALKNWRESKIGKRKGRKVGFPHRKKLRGARLTCRFTTGAFGLGPATDRRHIQLPRIGLVRTHESTRKLARRVEAATATIRSATLSFQRGRWQVSLSVEMPDPTPPPRPSGRVVGVDLGIKSLAVLSTGEVVSNPRHLDTALTTLRRMQRTCARRRGPDKRTKTKPSNRWIKAKSRVAALHVRVANLRRDGLHKFTTRLVAEHDTIVVENLNVAGMIRNQRLARHLSGLGMGEIRRQIEYKIPAVGGRVLVADRWYPSSKTCSACGVVKAKLRLSERIFVCESCGMTCDRDLNAARNLAALASEASEARTKKHSAGNPCKTATVGGNGYCHGKTLRSQRRPREVAAP